MSYVNLYSVYYRTEENKLESKMVNNYRKKQSHTDELDPKPIKLPTNDYVVYVWSTNGTTATLKAKDIYQKYGIGGELDE